MSTGGLLLGYDDDILQCLDSELDEFQILVNGWSQNAASSIPSPFLNDISDLENDDDEDHMVSPAVHSPPLPPTTTTTAAEEMTFVDDEIASSSAALSYTISFEPCETCNTRDGSIGIRINGSTEQKFCVTCSTNKYLAEKLRYRKDIKYTCYGCQKSFTSYHKARKKTKHKNCSLNQSTDDGSKGKNKRTRKRASSSNTTDNQPIKKQKVVVKTIIEFLLKRKVFATAGTVLPFNTEHQIGLYFHKRIARELTPENRDPPFLILLMQFYPTTEVVTVYSSDTTFLDKSDLLTIHVQLPAWAKPQEDDIAKVNIRVQFTHKKHMINSMNGSFAKSRGSPSDITFQENKIANKASSSITTSSAAVAATDQHESNQQLPNQQSATNSIATFPAYQPSNQQPTNQHVQPNDDASPTSSDVEDAFDRVDPRGFTDIEYSIASFDYDELERALQSNEYDLNARDNLGYTKEFWCYYFNNMKALKMIQEAKSRINPDSAVQLESEQCKPEKDQLIKWIFDDHSVLNLNDLSTSVRTLQLVDSKDGSAKCFEEKSNDNLTHVILGPPLHVDDSFDVEQFVTCCPNIQHLELRSVTYHDEQTVYDCWETIGNNASNLRKISLHFTSQIEYKPQIEHILSNCTLVEDLSIVTQEGTVVINELVEEYDSGRNLKRIDLKYESCDEETMKTFMILYGNICELVVTKRDDKILLRGQPIPIDIFHLIMSFIPAFPCYFMLRSVCRQWLYEFEEHIYSKVTHLNLVDDGKPKYYFRRNHNGSQETLVQFKPIGLIATNDRLGDDVDLSPMIDTTVREYPDCAQSQQVVVGAVGAVNEALLINSFGKCDDCKKNNGTIGIQTSDCILPQRLCVTCAKCKSKGLTDARFICYGCDASFDSFEKSRKKMKHGHCSLKPKRTTSTKQQKRPSSSTTNLPESSDEISLTSLSSSLDKTSKKKPDAEAIVNNNKETRLSRDNSGHVFSLTLRVISKNNLPAHWRGNLAQAISNKLKEIEYKYPSIRVKLNNSSFEIYGSDIQECIKVKQLLVFRMVDVLYTKQHYHSNRYLLKVSSKEENLDLVPHELKLFAGDKNFHTYRLKESSLPDVTQFEYPHPPKNLDKIKVLYTDGQDNISYSKDTITREIIMEELRNANVNRVMAKIYLGGTMVVKSKMNLKGKATTGPQLENGANAFQWHFDRDEIFNRKKMEKMLQSLKGSTLIHSNDPLNVYSVTLYDTQVTKDFTISLRMEDPDENGISRLVPLEEERYITYDMSKNKAFSFSVDDTSRSSSMENGYIVKFWEGENRISRYETAKLVAESLIFNHNLGLFLFSDSNTDPLFQDASGRFWVKGGKKWTSESFFSVQHEDGREYKVELWNGDKPSIQLGPEDVYSTDYEQDYAHLMKFADHLIDQYNQY